eukprot:gene10745-2833_t
MMLRFAFARNICRFNQSSALPVRSFHVARAVNSSEGLRDVLVKEMETEQELGVPPKFSDDIRGFKVDYTPGIPVINLTNVVDGDIVKVRLNLNECDMPEASPYEEQEEEEDEAISPRPVFSVSISNEAKGKSLMLSAFIEAENLVITRMGVKPNNIEEDSEFEKVYFTDFQHLDEKVQEQTASYLAEKGIGAELCREIEGLVADAEYNEYLKWLQDTSDFLK